MLKKRRDAAEAADHWGSVGPPRPVALDFYREFISPGVLVFDVGANVGNRTELFVELGAEVVAFEPQPSCAASLAASLGTHGAFTLLRVAVGATPGKARLRLAGADVLATTSSEFVEATAAAGRFSLEQRWTGDEVVVRTTTLDVAIAMFGTPAFIKIDVEGAEPQVLRGLTQPVPALSFEFTRELMDHARECLAQLEALGNYRYAFSAAETLVLGPWVPGGELLASLDALPALSWGDVYALAR
jgi:FkbM family methyltransferase